MQDIYDLTAYHEKIDENILSRLEFTEEEKIALFFENNKFECFKQLFPAVKLPSEGSGFYCLVCSYYLQATINNTEYLFTHVLYKKAKYTEHLCQFCKTTIYFRVPASSCEECKQKPGKY